MAGDADSVNYFSHIQRYNRLRVKPDAKFYAWCYVTGRFKGPLKPTTLYHFYDKESIEGHIARIRAKVNLQNLEWSNYNVVVTILVKF